MKVLVTGGTGYIGSHTVVELQQAGMEVVIVDNLSNSKKEVAGNIARITGKRPLLDIFDLCDRERVKSFFQHHHDIQAIIHFAAFKSVYESVRYPVKYYRNNIDSTLNLLEGMLEYEIPYIVFSSSCTVYGQPDRLPVTEDMPLKKAESPYGNTKKITEEMIRDVVELSAVKASILR
jgi:UDP-glucose 4-epimerase